MNVDKEAEAAFPAPSLPSLDRNDDSKNRQRTMVLERSPISDLLLHRAAPDSSDRTLLHRGIRRTNEHYHAGSDGSDGSDGSGSKTAQDIAFFQTATNPWREEEAEAYVAHIGDNDVLLGRGSGPSSHIGNRKFRQIVQAKNDEYVALEPGRGDKIAMAREVVDTVHAYNGRFLRKLEQDEIDRLVAARRSKAATAIRTSLHALNQHAWPRTTAMTDHVLAATAMVTKKEDAHHPLFQRGVVAPQSYYRGAYDDGGRVGDRGCLLYAVVTDRTVLVAKTKQAFRHCSRPPYERKRLRKQSPEDKEVRRTTEEEEQKKKKAKPTPRKKMIGKEEVVDEGKRSSSAREKKSETERSIHAESSEQKCPPPSSSPNRRGATVAAATEAAAPWLAQRQGQHSVHEEEISQSSNSYRTAEDKAQSSQCWREKQRCTMQRLQELLILEQIVKQHHENANARIASIMLDMVLATGNRGGPPHAHHRSSDYHDCSLLRMQSTLVSRLRGGMAAAVPVVSSTATTQPPAAIAAPHLPAAPTSLRAVIGRSHASTAASLQIPAALTSMQVGTAHGTNTTISYARTAKNEGGGGSTTTARY